MVRVGLIGLGKMGLSHLAIARSHPDVQLTSVCDASTHIADAVGRLSHSTAFTNYVDMMNDTPLDAVIVATPSHLHEEIVRSALDRNLSVFCEKPFCLDVQAGHELAQMAADRRVANQVGYHARFLATFREAKRIIASGALGRVHHFRAEAYGPVVLRPLRRNWRTSGRAGGGCLYDYGSHAIDLITFLFGVPTSVKGTVMRSVFSPNVDDEVYATLLFADQMTGQLAVNWSDESLRKMSIRINCWGTNGRIIVDRQEVQIYIRQNKKAKSEVPTGWSARYVTDLTDGVWFYLRGEEYSAQIDHFISNVKSKSIKNISSFESAVNTDRVIAMLVADATGSPAPMSSQQTEMAKPRRATLKLLDSVLRRRIAGVRK